MKEPSNARVYPHWDAATENIKTLIYSLVHSIQVACSYMVDDRTYDREGTPETGVLGTHVLQTN